MQLPKGGVRVTTSLEHNVFWGRGDTKAQNAYAEFFWSKYHEIRAEQARWVNDVAARKWFRAPYGMKFYFPNARMSPSGWVTGSNQIANYPINN